jgi:hypothetical protein
VSARLDRGGLAAATTMLIPFGNLFQQPGVYSDFSSSLRVGIFDGGLERQSDEQIWLQLSG